MSIYDKILSATAVVIGSLVAFGLAIMLSSAMAEPPALEPRDRTLETMIELVALVPNSAGCNQVGSTICCFDWNDNAFCCDQKKPGDCPRLRLELRLGTRTPR